MIRLLAGKMHLPVVSPVCVRNFMFRQAAAAHPVKPAISGALQRTNALQIKVWLPNEVGFVRKILPQLNHD
ncbi:hypothetical protein [Novosphingobium sp. MMS21-SN21R]|uniref:hypothetical protein n=1 Tax=Novosphingobium sp. MMS21-SN21R TaxID=2969298 RepID=UPI002886FD83|nr:hypothetical protein [Novosphingobium sp. MMS21-SN21R]MDT0508294.1 hypothetical protein [Novosphingobium sp. MMS21-SN21R]